MKHRGQVVEKMIRTSGYTITHVAERLGINRNTVYNRLSLPNLDYDFIMEIGNVIHHDFTEEFPEIKDNLSEDALLRLVDRETAELWKAEENYINLLEQYNKMLESLASLANQNTFNGIKREISSFIEEQQRP